MEPTDHDLLIGLVAQVAALDRLMQERHERDREELVSAARAMDSRLEKLNEFRAAMADITATMMPREEVLRVMELHGAKLDTVSGYFKDFLRADVYENQHGQLTDRVVALETWRTSVTARVTVVVSLAVIFGGTLGGLIGHVIH